MSKTSVALTTTGQFVLTTEAGTVVLTKAEAARLSGELSSAQFEHKRLNTPAKSTPVFEVGDTVRSRTAKLGAVYTVRTVDGELVTLLTQNGQWFTSSTHLLELVKKAPKHHRRLFKEGDIVRSKKNNLTYVAKEDEMEGRPLRVTAGGETYPVYAEWLELVEAAPEPAHYKVGDTLIYAPSPGLPEASYITYTVLAPPEGGYVRVRSHESGLQTDMLVSRTKKL